MKKYKKIIALCVILVAFCVSICFIPINASVLIPEIEKQAELNYGTKVHIEKLIFRFGPSLKLKAPIMHILYEDGQKFGQFNNVKFYVNWSSLFKRTATIKRIYADKFFLRVNSDDKYLKSITEKLILRKFEENPDVSFKTYNITYFDKTSNRKYNLTGNDLFISKLNKVKNYKISAIGDFLINDKKYLSIDISIKPNINFQESSSDFDISSFLAQIEALNFTSDIFADIEIYKNIKDDVQISGLLNIDNISILDVDNKTPKSFIYLTFLGKKIGIYSNIYTSANSKANVEGAFNISNKKSLDLKVKTDELELSDLYNKLKLFAGISNLKYIETINGKIKADFYVKGDLNKLKSSGFFNVKDASIVASGIDIHKISADVDLSNNVINITNAVGYVKDAPILLKGKINKDIDLELLMNKVDISHLLPNKFGVKSGIASMVAKITGTADKIIHKEKLNIDNFKYAANDIEVNANNFKIDTNKDSIASITNVTIENPETELIKVPSVRIYVDKEAIKIPDTSVFMANSKITAKADVLNYNSSDFSFNVFLYGFVNSRDIIKFNKISTVYPVKFNLYGDKSVQNVLGQILAEKATYFDSPTLLNLNSKIEKNTVKIEDLSVLNFNGNFSNDLKSNLKGNRNIIISGNIENFKEPEFKNMRIIIPQLLNLTVADTVAQLKGDLFVNGKIKAPEIIGQISIQTLINQFMQFSASNLTVDFNKNSAVINAPQVRIADTTLGLTSTVMTDVYDKLLIKNLNVKSKYINTDTLLMYEDSPVIKNVNVEVQSGNIYSEKLLINLYGNSLYLSALNSNLSLSNNNLELNNISAELLNGKIAGNLKFNLLNEFYNTKLQARGISSAPIFEIISPKNEAISGTMDFDASLEGCLTSKKSIKGITKFIVHNGRMGTLGKLEHLLCAQNVISDSMLRVSLSSVTKAISLSDTGLFKFLRGEAEVNEGLTDIKYLQTQGPLMSLFIKGQYNIDTMNAKLVVLGRISDEIFDGLGNFGDFSINKLMVMLTGEEKRYNIRYDDYDKIPPLQSKNTREFRSIISGIIDKPSSVILFNWISTSQKSYRQNDVPDSDTKIPDFVDKLPY